MDSKFHGWMINERRRLFLKVGRTAARKSRGDDSPCFGPALRCPRPQHTRQTISFKAPSEHILSLLEAFWSLPISNGLKTKIPKLAYKALEDLPIALAPLLTFRPVFAWLLLPRWPLLFPEHDRCSHEGLCIGAWFPHPHNVRLFSPSHFFNSRSFPPIDAAFPGHFPILHFFRTRFLS